MLTRDGIKPMPNKVDAILNLARPTDVKQLRRVLGIVQYYRDIWEKRSHVLAPLTDLVGECGHTIKPMPNKVDAILNLARPTNVKQLRRVLGIVQYYRDIWESGDHKIILHGPSRKT